MKKAKPVTRSRSRKQSPKPEVEPDRLTLADEDPSKDPTLEACGDHYKPKNSRKCYTCGKVTPIHEQRF